MRGITVISGMARGVDSVAHRACLDNFGKTIAVLGCGVDVVYPPENKGLYDEMRVETNTTLSVENGIKAPNAHGVVVEQFAVGCNTIVRYRNK